MSASDLATCQELFACWGVGGFHGPDRDANFDKFISPDCVIDYRFGTTHPALKPFDGIFHGKEGFFQNMGIHGIFDWQDMKVEFLPGPQDSVLIYMDCVAAVRATGKASTERTVCILQVFLREGKVYKSVYCFNGAAGWEALL